MRLSSLCLASVLVFSSSALAQHSSGGGGSSGASSSGGSHASSGSSSSASSAPSHGGSGTVSHSSSSHSSSSRTSSASRPSNAQKARASASLSAALEVRDPNVQLPSRSEMSGRQKFISFLRHPFRKTEPNAAKTADLRYRICFKGPCLVCPAGHAGGCTKLIERRRGICSAGETWNGGSCLLQADFLDDCSGLRAALARQEQRAQAADSSRQSACAAATSQDCSKMTRDAQSEADLYRTLQNKYRVCRQQSHAANPFSTLGSWRDSQRLRSDPLGLELNHP